MKNGLCNRKHSGCCTTWVSREAHRRFANIHRGILTIKGENKLSAGLFVLQIQRPVYNGVLACKFAGLAFGAFDGRCESLVLQQIHGSRTAVYETVIGSANIIQTAAFLRLCCLHGNYVITCNSSHASCATGYHGCQCKDDSDTFQVTHFFVFFFVHNFLSFLPLKSA